MRIIFWQNELAILQSAHIRSLAARPGHEVTLVAETDLYPERRALGWAVPSFGQARVLVAPDDAEIGRLVEERPSESVHIFTTIHAYRLVHRALRRAIRTEALVGIFSESGDFRGWKGLARLAVGRRNTLLYGRRIDFVVPTGQQGIRWFRRCGMAPSRTFPYGYWVENPQAALDSRPDPGPVRLMFLGQLIPRKGVDLVLRALAALREQRWEFVVMGVGAQEQELRAMARRLGIARRVRFLPARPNQEAIREVARSDVFILPSRFDGWGVVVNEALMCGVPVLCSSHCGAADLIQAPWLGEVFPAYSVAGLRTVLARWIAQGKRTPEATERIRSWSDRITGASASEYLLSVIRHVSGSGPRPTPPWYLTGNEAAPGRPLPREF